MSHPKTMQQARTLLSLCGLVAATPALWAQSGAATRGVVPVVTGTHAPLTAAELAIADQVLVGTLPCELGQTVRLEVDEQQPGYFRLAMGAHQYRVRPVETSTGTVRLEDQARGAVWIQLPHKSMLMNQKLGRRMADECVSPIQRAAAEAAKANPASHLLDVAQTPR